MNDCDMFDNMRFLDNHPTCSNCYVAYFTVTLLVTTLFFLMILLPAV